MCMNDFPILETIHSKHYETRVLLILNPGTSGECLLRNINIIRLINTCYKSIWNLLFPKKLPIISFTLNDTHTYV